MGAAQIAMIASTPITTGAEEGGQVIERMQPVERGAPLLWEYVLHLIDDAVRKGYLAA